MKHASTQVADLGLIEEVPGGGEDLSPWGLPRTVLAMNPCSLIFELS